MHSFLAGFYVPPGWSPEWPVAQGGGRKSWWSVPIQLAGVPLPAVGLLWEGVAGLLLVLVPGHIEMKRKCFFTQNLRILKRNRLACKLLYLLTLKLTLESLMVTLECGRKSPPRDPGSRVFSARLRAGLAEATHLLTHPPPTMGPAHNFRSFKGVGNSQHSGLLTSVLVLNPLGPWGGGGVPEDSQVGRTGHPFIPLEFTMCQNWGATAK